MTLSHASPNARPTHDRYVVLLFLCILAFLSYFDRVCIAGVKVAIKADLFTTDG